VGGDHGEGDLEFRKTGPNSRSKVRRKKEGKGKKKKRKKGKGVKGGIFLNDDSATLSVVTAKMSWLKGCPGKARKKKGGGRQKKGSTPKRRKSRNAPTEVSQRRQSPMWAGGRGKRV